MKFINTTYTDETINLDDNDFEGCTFVRCTLVYKGGVFRLAGNSLDSPRFAFDGAAANTLRFMAELYKGGASDIVESTFDNIRQGTPVPVFDAGNASN
jgi:hypothetical protein